MTDTPAPEEREDMDRLREATDHGELLREAAQSIRSDGTPAQVGLTANECDRIADEIDRLRSKATHVPEGWKLVPTYLTEAMISAAVDLGSPGSFDPDVTWDDIYTAMLSASPLPPVTEDGWRDISTAPKDGTRFWGRVDDDAIAMLWHERFGAFVSSWRRMSMAPGYKYQASGSDDWVTEHDHSPTTHEPTGWMPLPGAAPLPPAVGADRTQQILDDAATAIKIHDGVIRLKAERDAAFSNGVGAAADLIESKVRDYTAEHGSLDPETGAMEFSRSGEEYVSTLEELAEEIRAISGPVDQSALSAAVEAEKERCAKIVHAMQIKFQSDACGYALDAIRSGQGGQDV